jgi:hypothetical protein
MIICDPESGGVVFSPFFVVVLCDVLGSWTVSRVGLKRQVSW